MGWRRRESKTEYNTETAGLLEEPTGTDGNGRPDDSRSFPSTPANHVARHESAIAREYLEAGANGEPCAHLAVALATSVLREPSAALALQIVAGGEFVHARATELAERVLLAAANNDAARASPTERKVNGTQR